MHLVSIIASRSPHENASEHVLQHPGPHRVPRASWPDVRRIGDPSDALRSPFRSPRSRAAGINTAAACTPAACTQYYRDYQVTGSSWIPGTSPARTTIASREAQGTGRINFLKRLVQCGFRMPIRVSGASPRPGQRVFCVPRPCPARGPDPGGPPGPPAAGRPIGHRSRSLLS